MFKLVAAAEADVTGSGVIIRTKLATRKIVWRAASNIKHRSALMRRASLHLKVHHLREYLRGLFAFSNYKGVTIDSTNVL